MDLRLVAATEYLRRARVACRLGEERRHLRAGHHLLRIVQPLDDPLGIEPGVRHGEIGRPALGRSLRLVGATLMAREAVEVVLRREQLTRVDALGAERGPLEVYVRDGELVDRA